MLRLYLVALVCINAYFLMAVLSNVVYFRRATRSPDAKNGPFVSVIVPARNEEASIARCIKSLIDQEYEEYEIVVVDDDSDDSTAQIVASLAAGEPRVRLVPAGPPPDGWLGKPHALSQGAIAARGDILVLVDADTTHTPHSISWAVTNLEAHHADMLSGYLTQGYGSFGERIIVPTMYAMMLLVPISLVAATKSAQLAFAIGQYVVIRREALEGVGGFETIKNSIVDDMAMARRMKSFGYRNVFLDAKCAARCRLYAGYSDAFDGIKRSIYSSLGSSPLTVAAVSLIVLGLIVGPALSIPVSYLFFGAANPLLAAAVALFTIQWAVLCWDRNVPLTAFLLYPLVFLNLVVILNASMLSTGFGPGVEWRGRTVRVPRGPDVPPEPVPGTSDSSSN